MPRDSTAFEKEGLGPHVARTLTERCLLLLAAAACSLAAAPAAHAAPGVPLAPLPLFSETFESVSPPTTAVQIDGYVGPAPLLQTYTADPAWNTAMGCNGIVTSAASGDVTPCSFSAGIEALTAALGTFNGTSASTNHGLASMTANPPAPDLVVLETEVPIAVGAPSRFVAASMNVAASGCTTAAPLLKVYILDGATAIPTFAAPYNPCPPAVATATSTYTTPRAALVSGSTVGLRIVNGTGGAAGNEHGLDDIRVVDATPALDLALTSPVAAGATSRMTFTITNTTELAEKAGWSFADALGGLSVAALPNIASTCTGTSVAATPGSPTIAASGTLPTGVASCTVQVDVAGAPGVYANGPENITARTGLDAPATAATVTFEAPPPPPPPPDAKQGTSVTIFRSLGSVRVKVPGATTYADVTTLTEVPLGSRIDTRNGRVTLAAEVNAATGQTQSTWFYDGIFDISQTKDSKPYLVATLVGGTFAGCAPRATSRVALGNAAGPIPFKFAARKRSKRKVRRLWGQGQGNFRTAGRRSTATVRGTWWLVEDRCDGTLTRVRQGRVEVRDLRLKKTIQLRAGKRFLYLAKAP